MYARNEWAQVSAAGGPAPMGVRYRPTPVPRREDAVAETMRKRQESQRFVEHFVREHADPACGKKKNKDEDDGLKICEARTVALHLFRLDEKLAMMRDELKRTSRRPRPEWDDKWRECESVQNEIDKLVRTLEAAAAESGPLMKRIERRKQKRLREARRRAERKAEKALAAERMARLHAKADAWIREQQDIVEREKQTEHLRREADMVLADVRGKRADARKFLGLLEELRNLRRIKVNIARARGENLPLAADEAFDNIIGQLVDQWLSLDREYSIEELGLNLMLKTDNERKIERQKRSTFDHWETALFGRKLQSREISCGGDVRTLVMIRYAWDKYSNFNGEGSRIPVGWVMPVAPSSAAWQRCLRRIK